MRTPRRVVYSCCLLLLAGCGELLPATSELDEEPNQKNGGANGRISDDPNDGDRRSPDGSPAANAPSVPSSDTDDPSTPSTSRPDAPSDDPSSPDAPALSRPTNDERFALGPTGTTRLTRAEVRATLEDLFGPDFVTATVDLLPGDTGGGDSTPFDNDYDHQSASTALIEAIAALAKDAAAQFLEKPAVRSRVLTCSPAGPGDDACLRQFAASFGERALRRPLTDEELDALGGLAEHGIAADDFDVSASLVVQALLQDLEFWYRVQIGSAIDDLPADSMPLVELDDYEVASRLSYLMTGSTPDRQLLDSAAAGELSEPSGVTTQAQRLLDTPRARERIDRFHAMWLGYESSNLPGALQTRMRRETQALLDRVIFDDRASWFDLFEAQETFVDDTLAAHYGLELPGSDSPQWVGYGDSGRKGLLSHGTFLSSFGKFQDTSPTQRGILIRERLTCQPIPKPPPGLAVNVDQPPPATSESNCKHDRYERHRQEAGCANCHQQMDPIGFGLEQYDNQGRFRDAEADNPECEITGDGELVGVGEFNGPAELGELLVASGLLEECLARQYYRFLTGRFETAADEAAITELADRFASGGQRLDELMLDYVSLPAFGYRVVE